MKNSVFFIFTREDNRRKNIRCKIENYPHKPSVGDQVALPIRCPANPSRVLYGTVSQVIHDPMGCYFTDTGCEIVCEVECHEEDFGINYSFFLEKARNPGLNGQWANWYVSS